MDMAPQIYVPRNFKRTCGGSLPSSSSTLNSNDGLRTPPLVVEPDNCSPHTCSAINSWITRSGTLSYPQSCTLSCTGGMS
jgi:hypothetical protein